VLRDLAGRSLDNLYTEVITLQSDVTDTIIKDLDLKERHFKPAVERVVN
jgi:hypothetical protein